MAATSGYLVGSFWPGVDRASERTQGCIRSKVRVAWVLCSVEIADTERRLGIYLQEYHANGKIELHPSHTDRSDQAIRSLGVERRDHY